MAYTVGIGNVTNSNLMQADYMLRQYSDSALHNHPSEAIPGVMTAGWEAGEMGQNMGDSPWELVTAQKQEISTGQKTMEADRTASRSLVWVAAWLLYPCWIAVGTWNYNDLG